MENSFTSARNVEEISDKTLNPINTASKEGVVALTHALVLNLSPEVRVNCISSGWIEVRDVRKEVTRLSQISGISTTSSTPPEE